jgi:hypothetical protein
MQWLYISFSVVFAAIVAVLTVMTTMSHQQLMANLAGYFRDAGFNETATWITAHPSLFVQFFFLLCVILLCVAALIICGWINEGRRRARHRRLQQALATIFSKVDQLFSTRPLTQEQYDLWKNDVTALHGWIHSHLSGRLPSAEIYVITSGPMGPSLGFRGSFGSDELQLNNYLHYLKQRVSQSIEKYC